MPHFIKTDQGLVNLDYVRKIITTYPDRIDDVLNAAVFVLIGPDGDELGFVSSHIGTAEELTCPITPASQGALAWLISVNSDKGRPVKSDLVSEMILIIGWRVTSMGTTPVFSSEPGDYDVVLYEMPGGTMSEPNAGWHHSLDAAQASILARWQAAWDREAKVNAIAKPSDA